MSGRKFDSIKSRYDLIPPDALEEVVKNLTFGSFKYDDNNWRKVDDCERRYFAAAQRHLWQFWGAYRVGANAEEFDDEMNLHHIAAAITNLMFVLQLRLETLDSKTRQDTVKKIFEEAIKNKS